MVEDKGGAWHVSSTVLDDVWLFLFQRDGAGYIESRITYTGKSIVFFPQKVDVYEETSVFQGCGVADGTLAPTDFVQLFGITQEDADDLVYLADKDSWARVAAAAAARRRAASVTQPPRAPLQSQAVGRAR